tara:strand:+ start:837 stop:1463 length:627 start_codon:yes stop_codon:yes gene_type:complete
MSSKFSSSFFKKSPLSVSVATGYVSTRDSLQRMFDDISKGTSKAIEGAADPQIQADRLERRIESRSKRADKKQKKADELEGKTRTIDPKTGVETITTKSDKELTNREEKKVKRLRNRVKNIKDKNTNILTPRKKKAQDKADSDMTKKLEQYEALYDIKNSRGLTLEEREKEAEDNYIAKYGQKAWDDLGKDGQESYYDKKIQYVKKKN